MKTGAEWIMDFDESTQTKIIINIDVQAKDSEEPDPRETKYSSIGAFLLQAFHWEVTHEGHEYWRNIYYSLEEEEE